jgi:Putative phage metallopeptidase
VDRGRIVKVVDPGHDYFLGTLDGSTDVRLIFVKREGPGYDQAPDMFVVEIAFDAWEVLTERQRVALVDHELCHLVIEGTETGEIVRRIKGHDVEEFQVVAERHGAWKPDLADFAKALQLRMST